MPSLGDKLANEIDKLSIVLGFELAVQELNNSLKEATDAINKSTEKNFAKSGKKSSEKFGKAYAVGLSKTKDKIKRSADKNIGKPIENSVRKSVGVAQIAIGNLIANQVQKLGAAIGNAFKSGVSNAVQFEKGIAEVNSILDANNKVTKETEQSILRFAANFGTSQQKQVRSFYNIISAGITDTNNALATLNIANKAAVAGLVDIDTAAFALVSSVNAYARAGLTAQRASDVLFRGVKEGQVV